ncbi:fumarylacetoacetate hydrolase family protein [Rhizobium sp. BK251]|uniref:fumarylacetoacetate hydrolase family protein n=1 Tax=Rhizobium sp. BK251 TaxID=2512125 RepID=UPI00104B3B4E|nr:fumarylacetoacetate hydrolase family protein [Rhizobium sp. BK251]TCL74902.1 2-keto-4-pentenoate hydratase/2-oxohepta-3-ene-1,7-dioic acid hydratase in catechol pathway [Rhizobium sp. BK251]
MQQFARVLTGQGAVPVILKGNVHLDLRPIVSDITPDTIAGGALTEVDTSRLVPVNGDFTYLAPINGVRQIAATGFNYKKHIEEFKMKPPTEPEVFLKAISSLTGPLDPIFRGPNQGVKLDWEAELAIVVGREARDITAAEADDYIFGYVCINDISDRTTQVDAEGQQHLVRAKSRPSYSPIGPYLTTGIDGMKLDVWSRLNGEYEQRGNTSDMLFSVHEMLAYFSSHMALLPGDILATGTPPGVGFGKNRYMAVGDVLECGITDLGAQRHEIRR